MDFIVYCVAAALKIFFIVFYIALIVFYIALIVLMLFIVFIVFMFSEI